jgi:hypothetical protein
LEQTQAVAEPQVSKAEPETRQPDVAPPNSALASLLTDGEQGAPEDWLIRAPDMSGWGITRLIDERDQLQEWLSRRTTSSQASSTIEAALAQVTEALARKSKALQKDPARATKRRAVKHPAKAGGPTGAASPELPMPRILRERSSVQYTDPAEMRTEVDLIAEWLQHGDLSRADCQILRAELTNLAPLVEQDRAQRADTRRSKNIKQALTAGGNPRTAVLDQVRLVDRITPLPGEPGVQALMHGDEMIRLTDEEVVKLRAEVMAQLDKAADRARSMNEATYSDGQDWLKLNYDEHWFVGLEVSLFSGEQPDELWERVVPTIRRSNTLITQDYRQVREREDVPLAKKAEIVLLAVDKAGLARWLLNDGTGHAQSVAGDIATGLTITRDAAFALAASLGAVALVPVAAGLTAGAGLTGGLGVGVSFVGTGVAIGGGDAVVRGGSAMIGVVGAGGTIDDALASGRTEGWRGFKEGLAIGAGGSVARSAGQALGLGAQNLGRAQKLWRIALAGGSGNAAGEATSAALEGKSGGDVAWSTLKGFGSGTLGSGIGGLASRVPNPVARYLVQTGAGSLLAGGATYVAGGTRNEVVTSLAIGGVTSALANSAPEPVGYRRNTRSSGAPAPRALTSGTTPIPPPVAPSEPVLLYDWADRPMLVERGAPVPVRTDLPLVLGPDGRFPRDPLRPVRIFTPEGDALYLSPGLPPARVSGPTPLYVRPDFAAGVQGGRAPAAEGVPIFTSPREATWAFDDAAQRAVIGPRHNPTGIARIGLEDAIPLWTSPTESGLFSGGRQVTSPYVAPQVPQNQAWRAAAAMMRRDQWARNASKRGMTPVEYAAQADASVARLVQGAEVRVRAPVAAVTEIIRTGRLLNQFETGTTGGLLDLNARRSVEAGLWATGPEAGGAQRPIYGYLSGTMEATSAQYGDVVLRLRPTVRPRTTFTFGDSLDETTLGIRPTVAGEPLTRPTALAAQRDTDPLRLGSLADVESRGYATYTEAQVHGGVTLEDIHEVVFTNGVIPSPQVRATLETARIPWRIVRGSAP